MKLGMHVILAVAKATSPPVQWWTLAWVAGAAIAATLIITVIVLVSRRPKSMEDGMAEFSRSLQAVAPTHRSATRATGEVRSTAASRPELRSVRALRGESETV